MARARFAWGNLDAKHTVMLALYRTKAYLVADLSLFHSDLLRSPAPYRLPSFSRFYLSEFLR